jgi:hypothetical protein
MSKFGKQEGLLGREIFGQAAAEAFSRCPKLEPKSDVKAMFIGHMGESYEHQGHMGAFPAAIAAALAALFLVGRVARVAATR